MKVFPLVFFPLLIDLSRHHWRKFGSHGKRHQTLSNPPVSLRLRPNCSAENAVQAECCLPLEVVVNYELMTQPVFLFPFSFTWFN